MECNKLKCGQNNVPQMTVFIYGAQMPVLFMAVLHDRDLCSPLTRFCSRIKRLFNVDVLARLLAESTDFIMKFSFQQHRFLNTNALDEASGSLRLLRVTQRVH
jgi:hypothetical protein